MDHVDSALHLCTSHVLERKEEVVIKEVVISFVDFVVRLTNSLFFDKVKNR